MSIEEIKARHAQIMGMINDPGTTELRVSDPAINMDQMGLRYALVDQLGRIWQEVEPYHLKMVFDPNWLHPSKRWNGPRVEREVPKTRSPRDPDPKRDECRVRLPQDR